MPLGGRPMIEWSLRAAAASETIGFALVAAPEGAEEQAERSLSAAGLDGRVVSGGPTRAESVRIAVAEADTDLVAVHDAARPLVTAALFDAVVGRLGAAEDAAAAIAAAPINDTVKRGAAPRPGAGPPEPVVVEATLPREYLWAAQTPQVFRVAALTAAQDRAGAGELEAATDEAALIEAAGGVVVLVPAPASNLKVTTAHDLATAEALLAAAGRV